MIAVLLFQLRGMELIQAKFQSIALKQPLQKTIQKKVKNQVLVKVSNNLSKA
jgi:hypothetical protein